MVANFMDAVIFKFQLCCCCGCKKKNISIRLLVIPNNTDSAWSRLMKPSTREKEFTISRHTSIYEVFNTENREYGFRWICDGLKLRVLCLTPSHFPTKIGKNLSNSEYERFFFSRDSYLLILDHISLFRTVFVSNKCIFDVKALSWNSNENANNWMDHTSHDSNGRRGIIMSRERWSQTCKRRTFFNRCEWFDAIMIMIHDGRRILTIAV